MNVLSVLVFYLIKGVQEHQAEELNASLYLKQFVNFPSFNMKLLLKSPI